MKRDKLLEIPFVELLVAGLVILLPLANSPDLMFEIQTTKSLGFFYGLLALGGFGAFLLTFGVHAAREDEIDLNDYALFTGCFEE